MSIPARVLLQEPHNAVVVVFFVDSFLLVRTFRDDLFVTHSLTYLKESFSEEILNKAKRGVRFSQQR